MTEPAKLVALIGFTTAAAATQAGHGWAFGCLGVLVLAAVVVSGTPPSAITSKLVLATPIFIGIAIIPFVAQGPTIELATPLRPLTVSEQGLSSAWSMMARAALGITAVSTVLHSSTREELLTAAGRLRLPGTMLAIASFMLRYTDVVSQQFDQSLRSMRSRGFAPRWIWHSKPMATAAGTLFVKSYERGERIHGAMLSRGFDGTIPNLDGADSSSTLRNPYSSLWSAMIVVVAWSVAVASQLWNVWW